LIYHGLCGCGIQSSFVVLIQPIDKYKINWRVKPLFSVTLHKKDTGILEDIKKTLGVDKVNIKEPSQVVYRVKSFKELKIIINHFGKYPLVAAKLSDFLIFKQCFELINQGEYLTKDSLLKIISLKTNLNLGLPPNLIEAFPKIIPIIKPKYIFKGILDLFWVSGFTSGDGSFNLKIEKSATTLIGRRIQLRFGIGLHIKELDVIKGLAAYFNLLYPLTSKSIKVSNIKYKNITTWSNIVDFQVTKFSDVLNVIIPFFDKYSIQGQKALDFED
jgi:LAGLIDADG endonuclease